MSSPLLRAVGVRKRFGDVDAVADVSFDVEAGQILGLLGPNGAGKTTIVRMLTTLLPIDGGSATIGGHDVAGSPERVRRLIGLAGQAAAVDEKLSARENLELFGRLYKLPRPVRRRRIDELVERFDLASFADRPTATLSGGQRRRVDIVVALIADPAVLFLDEPTTGLDPRSRAEVWAAIRGLADAGTAIVLTTQYLEEADRLAGQIVVIDRGSTVAVGTPEELKRRIGVDVLEVKVADLAPAIGALPVGAGVDPDRRTIDLPVIAGADESLLLLESLKRSGVTIEHFQLRRPTLDDVFLALTGTAATSANELETAR